MRKLTDTLTYSESEMLYGAALEGIAQGATRAETRDYLSRTYGIPAGHEQLEAELRNAAADALDAGLEREDIDSTWHRWLSC